MQINIPPTVPAAQDQTSPHSPSRSWTFSVVHVTLRKQATTRNLSRSSRRTQQVSMMTAVEVSIASLDQRLWTSTKVTWLTSKRACDHTLHACAVSPIQAPWLLHAAAIRAGLCHLSSSLSLIHCSCPQGKAVLRLCITPRARGTWIARNCCCRMVSCCPPHSHCLC